MSTTTCIKRPDHFLYLYFMPCIAAKEKENKAAIAEKEKENKEAIATKEAQIMVQAIELAEHKTKVAM